MKKGLSTHIIADLQMKLIRQAKRRLALLGLLAQLALIPVSLVSGGHIQSGESKSIAPVIPLSKAIQSCITLYKKSLQEALNNVPGSTLWQQYSNKCSGLMTGADGMSYLWVFEAKRKFPNPKTNPWVRVYSAGSKISQGLNLVAAGSAGQYGQRSPSQINRLKDMADRGKFEVNEGIQALFSCKEDLDEYMAEVRPDYETFDSVYWRTSEELAVEDTAKGRVKSADGKFVFPRTFTTVGPDGFLHWTLDPNSIGKEAGNSGQSYATVASYRSGTNQLAILGRPVPK